MTTTTATCDGRNTGVAATDWGFESLPCNATQFLTRYTDATGVERRHCYQHRLDVRRRFPAYRSEIEDDGLGQAKAAVIR